MRQCALQLAHEAVVCTEVQAGISSELFAGCEADMLLEILVDGILGDASVSHRTKGADASPEQAGSGHRLSMNSIKTDMEPAVLATAGIHQRRSTRLGRPSRTIVATAATGTANNNG